MKPCEATSGAQTGACHYRLRVLHYGSMQGLFEGNINAVWQHEDAIDMLRLSIYIYIYHSSSLLLLPSLSISLSLCVYLSLSLSVSLSPSECVLGASGWSAEKLSYE